MHGTYISLLYSASERGRRKKPGIDGYVSYTYSEWVQKVGEGVVGVVGLFLCLQRKREQKTAVLNEECLLRHWKYMVSFFWGETHHHKGDETSSWNSTPVYRQVITMKAGTAIKANGGKTTAPKALSDAWNWAASYTNRKNSNEWQSHFKAATCIDESHFCGILMRLDLFVLHNFDKNLPIKK